MRIFSYILRQYLKFSFGVLFLALFMFVLSDLVDKHSRLFVKFEASSFQIVQYYLYEIPFQAIQILPFAALIGSVGAMMLFNRGGEIVALRAAGMGPFRIGKPIFFGGILFSVVTFYVSQVVVPRASIERNHLLEKLKGGTGGESGAALRWVKDGPWVYSFSNYILAEKTLENVKAFKYAGSGVVLQQLWGAKTAVYDEDANVWNLKQYFEVSLSGQRVSSYAEKDGIALPLPFEPAKLFKDERSPIEFSYTELKNKVQDFKQSGTQYRRFEVSYHVKLATCFAALLLSLLGLKFGFKFERSTAVVKSLLLTLAVGVGYWFVLSATRAIVLSSSLPAWIAGWTANMLLVLILSWELKRLSKVQH